MNTFLTTASVSASLLVAVWFGMWLRRFLPEHHLCPDSRDTVKLAMGLVVTMSAILLGLLVNAGKVSYDTTRSEVLQVASRYAFLDRLLSLYGPQAAEARGKLHTLMEATTLRLWPDEAITPVESTPSNQVGDAFYLAILRLEPRDDSERVLKAQSASLTLEIGQIRSLMKAESTTSIPKPMLVVVILWLVIVFFGLSLIAPPNATANFALIASALCVVGAVFMILELDRPFDGLMRISNVPMLNVLRPSGKQGL